MLMLSSRTSGAMYLPQDSSESSSPPSGSPTFRSQHLPLRAHALVGSDVDGVRDGLVADGQAQVSDGAHAVLLNQDVLRFEVTVSDARFTCGERVVSSDTCV